MQTPEYLQINKATALILATQMTARTHLGDRGGYTLGLTHLTL